MQHSEHGFEPLPCDNFYLTDLSAKDKPWDIHQGQADLVKAFYQESEFDKYATRIGTCSKLLEFLSVVDAETAEIALKLNHTHFCRVRQCPVCQWRRSLKWRARFFNAMPNIREAYPTARFIFLTLTVKNCELADLRETLTKMNRAWELLSKRKAFPALGWLKSVEVTKSITGTAHPHFHALLMVNASYFGDKYLSQEKWTTLWQEALRVDYVPIVNVKAIKPRKGSSTEETEDQLAKAVCETLKYSVKPDDLTADREWLLELTSQLHKTRAVAVGGVFKDFISDKEPEDLIHIDEEEGEISQATAIRFWWYELSKRYLKCQGTEEGK